jgi:hypothetical protein
MPVATFFSVTLAPGTTAPEESRTVPRTVAVSNCAKASDGSSSSAAASTARSERGAGRKRIIRASSREARSIRRRAAI